MSLHGEGGLGGIQVSKYEANDSALDIFTKPVIETSLEGGREIQFLPTNAVVADNPITFVIPSEALEQYTVLTSVVLRGEYQVKLANDNALGTTDNVATINNAPHSLFKTVDLTLGSTQLTDLSSATYAYRAYLEHHLSFSEGAKKTRLKASGWFPDESGKFNSTAVTGDDKNEGYMTRKGMQAASKSVSFEMPVICDLFQCGRSLIGGVDMKLQFIRSSAKFCLMTTSEKAAAYRINLLNLKLCLLRTQVDQRIVRHHQALWPRTPALYPIVQVKIKTFNIAARASSWNIANVFRGVLPYSLYIGLVDGGAFMGDVTKNPFEFKDQGVNLISLRVNGLQVPHSEPFRPDWSGKKYIREYMNLMKCIGVDQNYSDNGITPIQFATDSVFYGFDLNPDHCNAFHLHPGKEGNLDLNIEFGTAPTAPLQAIVYAQFNSLVTVDANRDAQIISL